MPFVEEPQLPVNATLENFKGLQDEVLRFGFNDGPQVNRRRVKGWINEALFLIAREVEASEFQATEPLVMEVGVFKYKLPGDFLRMQDIRYEELPGRLRPIDLGQFDRLARFEALPEAYTLYASEVWLYPTPAKTDELELRYIADPSGLTADTDVPRLNPNYWHLLVQYAVARAFEAEDDQEAAQAHKAEFKANLAAYATDVQFQSVDTPRRVEGTWSGGYW